MAIPLAAAIALKYGVPAVGSFLSTGFGRKRQDKQAELDRELARQSLGLQESGMNPFRHQVDQARSLSSLDRLARSRYTPVQMQATGPYASHVPEMSGGYSYEKSPELVSDALRLQQDVRAGRVAPTQTNPLNLGQTGVLNLANGGQRRRLNRGMFKDDEELYRPSYL